GAVVVSLGCTAGPEIGPRVFKQGGAQLLGGSLDLTLFPPTPNLPFQEFYFLPPLRSFPPTPPPPEDSGQIVFTSRTPGEPKGVVITHGNILANLEPIEREIQKYLRYERIFHPLRFLNLLPLSHVFGQFMGIFVPPLIGATVLFLESIKPSEIVGKIRG